MYRRSFWARAMMTLALVGASLVGPSATASVPVGRHVLLARKLVETVTPAANDYGSPAKLTWIGENGLDHSTARAKCASFLTELLKKAYAVDFPGWLGSTSPHAACYHDAIEVEDGFMLIESIKDVRVGDIVAIRYLDSGCEVLTCGTSTGCSSTGHVMLVVATPTAISPAAPLIAGTLQYTLEILDATSDPHGSGDSRWKAGPGNVDDQGVGRGKVRLYVSASDPTRPIVGYTWSTSSASTYYTHVKRDLVIGRYVHTSP